MMFEKSGELRRLVLKWLAFLFGVEVIEAGSLFHRNVTERIPPRTQLEVT
jgi:hypothetical protein